MTTLDKIRQVFADQRTKSAALGDPVNQAKLARQKCEQTYVGNPTPDNLRSLSLAIADMDAAQNVADRLNPSIADTAKTEAVAKLRELVPVALDEQAAALKKQQRAFETASKETAKEHGAAYATPAGANVLKDKAQLLTTKATTIRSGNAAISDILTAARQLINS